MTHPRGSATPMKRQPKQETPDDASASGVDEAGMWDEPLPSPVAEADGAAITVKVAKVPTTRVDIGGRDVHFRMPSRKTAATHIQLFAQASIDVRIGSQMSLESGDSRSYEQLIRERGKEIEKKFAALETLWSTIVYKSIADAGERAYIDELLNDDSNDDSWTISVTSQLILAWAPLWQADSGLKR